MGFTVRARKGGQDYQHRYGLMVTAFDMALTLTLACMSDVQVTDDAGRTYSHSDLSRLLCEASGEAGRTDERDAGASGAVPV